MVTAMGAGNGRKGGDVKVSSIFDLLALSLTIVAIGLFTRPTSQGPALIKSASTGWASVIKAVSSAGT
jgi:hypothetical protein